MSKRNLLICGILIALLAAGAWRARHRVRDYLARLEEERARSALESGSGEAKDLPPAAPLQVAETDWPWWRGPQHNNHAPGPPPPLTWSETENVLWKTPIPGRGHSSPCILGDRIFLTTAFDDPPSQKALCLDRQTGAVLWTTPIHQGKFLYRNAKNSDASSTPATDGRHVFVLFAVDDAIWLSSLTLDGEIEWQSELGPYISKEGFGASPLIVGNLVIVAADNVNRSWLAAVHRDTGDTVWRIPRGPGTSYASPTLIDTDAGPRVIVAGLDRVTAYVPEDGSEAWQVAGPDMSASTPVAGDGMLFVTGCTQQSGLFGFRLGEPTETLWTHPMKVEVPSPLYADGLVFMAQDIGVMLCYDAETGEQVYRKRLGSNVSASPIEVAGHILVPVEDGRTFVLKVGREFDIVTENQLDDEILATPAVSGGRIVFRTLHHVYCIGTPDERTGSGP